MSQHCGKNVRRLLGRWMSMTHRFLALDCFSFPPLRPSLGLFDRWVSMLCFTLRSNFFPPHQRRDFIEIYFKGRWECNNETFFTLNFKMPISILKFKFSIKFAFALYPDSPKWTTEGLLICFCSLFFCDSYKRKGSWKSNNSMKVS